MTEPFRYVPFLKGKSGEFSALPRVSAYDLQVITPFVDIPILPRHGERIPTPEGHFSKVATELEKHWGDRGPVFVDARLVEEGLRLADGTHPFRLAAEEAADAGVQFVPVTGLRRESAYQDAVRAALRRVGGSTGLRIEAEDVGANLGAELDRLLSFLEVSPGRVDLFIDFRALSRELVQPLKLAALEIFRTFPRVREWRTLTFAAGSFPSELGEMEADRTKTVPRAEWQLWKEVLAQRGTLPRMPAFGDYAISHPDMIDFDPKRMTVPVSLRYTTPTDYLVLKEGAFKREGGAGFVRLCKRMVKRREYCGEAFSWGDAYIHACAKERRGGGTPAIWRRVGTSHHLTLVSLQLREIAGSRANPGGP